MLVLSRKEDESIMIGDDIKVMVLRVQGDKVRLGVDAPRGVIVDREHIWRQKKGLPPLPKPAPLRRYIKRNELATGQSNEAQERLKSEAVLKPVLPPRS